MIRQDDFGLWRIPKLFFQELTIPKSCKLKTMVCLSTCSLAAENKGLPHLSSDMFQMSDSSFQIEASDLFFGQEHEDSSSLDAEDDEFSMENSESSTANPNLILDGLLEPTPFQEGTSLQLTSTGKKITATVVPNRPVMTYKPSLPSVQHLPSLKDEDLKWSDFLSFMEKNRKSTSSSSSLSKNVKRSKPAQTADNTFICPMPLTKRQRIVSSEDLSDEGPRLRPHQDVLWHEHFDALVDFKNKYGHCHVHYTCGHDQALSKWVQRQRYQYKLKSAGKKSTMTEERQEKLESVGFIWDSHAATWQQRLAELAEYKKENGDCKVPSTFPQNPQLAMWVKSQRRQYKLYRSGLSSNLSEDRLEALNQLDFTWELRNVGDSSPLAGDLVESNNDMIFAF